MDPYVQRPHGEKLAAWLESLDTNARAAVELNAAQGEAVGFRYRMKGASEGFEVGDWHYNFHRSPDSFELRECEIETVWAGNTTPPSADYNPCKCVDCGGTESSHSDDCTYMNETFGEQEYVSHDDFRAVCEALKEAERRLDYANAHGCEFGQKIDADLVTEIRRVLALPSVRAAIGGGK